MRKFLALIAMALSAAGCADPNFEAGKSAYERGDYDTAIDLLQRPAERGNPEAQYLLGYLAIDNWIFGDQDLELAFNWMQKAAEQGHPDAQYWLAWFYSGGAWVYVGDEEAVVETDRTQALYWFRKAEAAGRWQAAEQIARIHACEGDAVAAARWAERAVATNPDGARRPDFWELDIWPCDELTPIRTLVPPHDPEALRPEKAVADARNAIAAGDMRYLAVAGFSLTAPGVSGEGRTGINETEYRIIGGTTDGPANELESQYFQNANDYAEAYNTVMAAHKAAR